MTNISVTEQKRLLRRKIKLAKQQFSFTYFESFSAPIARRLLSLEAVKTAKTVMLYSSMADEVDTSGIIKQLSNKGKQVLLPVVISDTEMEIRLFTSFDAMKPGAYGIAEPMGKAFTDFQSIDVIVVPGIAFDAEGNRIGHGKGYYDRFFRQVPGALKVGICFPFQLVERVPTDTFDIKMDYIITNNNIFDCKQTR